MTRTAPPAVVASWPPGHRACRSPVGAPVITSSHLTALRSTLPLVEARAAAIADDFYARLFADRPDLLRDQFNRGDQAQGRQQRELALTIVTVARDVVGTQVGSGPAGSATGPAVPVAPWASPAPSPWAVRVAARETL